MLIKGKLWPHRYDSKHRHLFRDSGEANTSPLSAPQAVPVLLAAHGPDVVPEAAFCSFQPELLWEVFLWVVCADLCSYFTGVSIRNAASSCTERVN